MNKRTVGSDLSMMKCVACIALLVCLVLAESDRDPQLPAGEAKSRRRKPLPQPPPSPEPALSNFATTPPLPGSSLHLPPGRASVAWWEEKVPGKKDTIKEGGFSSAKEQVLAVGLFGRNLLKKFGYVGATTLYDFQPGNVMSAVRVRQPQTCFLIPIKDDVNFQNAAATLVSRNNSAMTIPRTAVFRDVRGDKPLGADDVMALNGTNRAVVTFCRGSPIYKTKNARESDLPKERQITVLSLDEAVTMAIPKSANADAFRLEPAKLDRVARLGEGSGRVQREKNSLTTKNAEDRTKRREN